MVVAAGVPVLRFHNSKTGFSSLHYRFQLKVSFSLNRSLSQQRSPRKPLACQLT